MTIKNYDQLINDLENKLKIAFERIQNLENKLIKLERQHAVFGPKNPYADPFNSNFFKEHFKDLNNNNIDKFKIDYKSEGGTTI